MSKLLLLVALAAAAMASPTPTTEVQKVSAANTAFTNKIFEQLIKSDGNVFFSPLSMHAVLSMAYQGASGVTKKEFETVLGVDTRTAAAGYHGLMTALNSVENITLNLANKIYLKDGYSMNPAFKKSVTGEMLSEVENINFAQKVAAADNINGWCRKKTNNRIDNLIKSDDLSEDTRLVLLNAIYFKGLWDKKFRKESTQKKDFFITPEKTVKVDMMFQSDDFLYGDNQELGAQVLQMQYSNKDFSMVVILPHEKNGIKDLQNKLVNYDLTKITQGLRKTKVDVSLPRFKIETEMDLKKTFEDVGLKSMFASNADFSAMLASPESLVVSKAIQKAFVEVNEEGAEAAAVTGIIRKTRSIVFSQTFNVDHPFFYAITTENEHLFQIHFAGFCSDLPESNEILHEEL